MPIIKSFYGDEGTFFAPQMYRAHMSDFYLRQETYKALEKTDKRAAGQYYRRHRELLAMESYVKGIEKRVRDMKQRGTTINDSQMQKTFKNFNRRMNTVDKKKVRRIISDRK